MLPISPVWLLTLGVLLFPAVSSGSDIQLDGPTLSSAPEVKDTSKALVRVAGLLEVRYKDPIDTVIRKAGEPEQRETPRNGIGKSTRWLYFHYGDAGSVHFKRFSDKRPERARVGHVEYRVKENFAVHGDNWLRVVLESTNPSALSAIAEYLENIQGYTETGYALIARRVERDMESEDAATVNGLSYLCLILGADPQARHAELLKTVEGTAATSKLRKHATQALKRLAAK